VGFFGHQTNPKYLAGLHFGYRLEIVKRDSWCEGQMKLPTGWLSSFRSKVLLWAIGCLLLIPHSVFAQEVASYDYTNTKHSDRLHPPLPPPSPKRLPNGMLAVEGVCGGISGNPWLAVSLVSLDRDSYAFGDEFIFVLRVKALYSTRVPFRASLAEIEPSDPNVSYEWIPLRISIELRSLAHRSVLVPLLSLYGSKALPESGIDLKAGKWIELRGKSRMKWDNLQHEVLPPAQEKNVLRLPLKRAEEFTASAFASRGDGFRYDAETKQEFRVCHSYEQSFGADSVHVSVTPRGKL
jgi:hypothetical protein